MKQPYRWRVVIEELEMAPGERPAWMVVTSCHRGDKWRQVARSPEYYETVSAAFTAARDRMTRHLEKSA